MKIEQQVCSLELAKRLKDLGVVEPSLFFFEWRGAKPHEIEFQEKPYHNPDNVNTYTVAELGEMLKTLLDDEFISYNFDNDEEFVWIAQVKKWSDVTFVGHTEHADTEANARAKMLVYLLENKLS
jgi:hypothetical protein